MTRHIPCKSVSDIGSRQSHFEDEVLETVWELREEKNEATYDDVLSAFGDEERLQRMMDNGLYYTKDGIFMLTDDGECRARDVIRRHRLAERLFADVLDIADFEADACRMEHAISHEVEEAICTMLGHPPRCPHGKAIPKGKCCEVYTRKMKPLVQNLAESEVGKESRIIFINSPSVDRLASIGLVPGAIIKLGQKRPSFVLQVEETILAIDEELASGIYVRQV